MSSLVNASDLRFAEHLRFVHGLYQSGGYLWIASSDGLYRLPLKGSQILEDLKLGSTPNFTQPFYEAGGYLWFPTSKGLARWRCGSESLPEVLELPLGRRSQHFLHAFGFLWICTDAGLYRWSLGSPAKPDLIDLPHGQGQHETLRSSRSHSRNRGIRYGLAGIYWAADRLWLELDGRLMKCRVGNEGNLILENLYEDVGRIGAFMTTRDALWIGTTSGLFLCLNGGRKSPERIWKGAVDSLYEAGNYLWTGTASGLWRIHIDQAMNTKGLSGAVHQVTVGDTGRVVRADDAKFVKFGQYLWIGCQFGGLYRWRLDGSAGLELVFDLRQGGVIHLHPVGEYLWIRTIFPERLNRWKKGSALPPQRINLDVISAPHSICKTADYLWIGADRGIVRIRDTKEHWEPRIEFDVTSLSGEPAGLAGLRWKIGSFAGSTTPALVEQTLIVRDRNGKHVSRSAVDPSTHNSFVIAFDLPQKSGNYEVLVEATNLLGTTGISRPLPLIITVPWWKKLLTLVPVGYACLTVLSFIFLLIGTRYWDWSFEILMHPHIRRFGVYFGLAILYIRPLKIWMLERYYQNLKDHFELPQYMAVPLSRRDCSTVLTTSMLDEVKEAMHIIVIGYSGSGKTSMIRKLLNIYCKESNLRLAFRQFGFVPILLELKYLAPGSIPSMALKSLQSHYVPLYDEKFFDHLLRKQGFLLLIDGLNETTVDRELIEFHTTHPRTRMLITSQTPLERSKIEQYHFPRLDASLCSELLTLFVGEETVSRLATQLDGLLGELESGYEVSLIADLINAGETDHLPMDRVGLYELTFHLAVSKVSNYPQSTITEFAWNLLLTKQRRFSHDRQLTKDLIEPLTYEPTVLLVRRGTEEFEFRHDLIRAYLAARWVLKDRDRIKDSLSILEDCQIWKLPPSEQDVFFHFLAELIQNPGDLTVVWKFSLSDYSRRRSLFEAVHATAVKRQWSILLELGLETNATTKFLNGQPATEKQGEIG